MPSPAEDRVDRVALHALEEVPSEEPVCLHVANLWFHGRFPSEVALEGGRVDFAIQPRIGWMLDGLARLRYCSIHAHRERIRLLMRENGLQAPGKPRRVLGPKTHDGTITTLKPDEMWDTDATSTMLLDGQQATIFGVCDH